MSETFFSPKAIAVIGASRDPHKLGYGVIRNVYQKFEIPVLFHIHSSQKY